MESTCSQHKMFPKFIFIFIYKWRCVVGAGQTSYAMDTNTRILLLNTHTTCVHHLYKIKCHQGHWPDIFPLYYHVCFHNCLFCDFWSMKKGLEFDDLLLYLLVWKRKGKNDEMCASVFCLFQQSQIGHWFSAFRIGCCCYYCAILCKNLPSVKCKIKKNSSKRYWNNCFFYGSHRQRERERENYLLQFGMFFFFVSMLFTRRLCMWCA